MVPTRGSFLCSNHGSFKVKLEVIESVHVLVGMGNLESNSSRPPKELFRLGVREAQEEKETTGCCLDQVVWTDTFPNSVLRPYTNETAVRVCREFSLVSPNWDSKSDCV